MANDNTFTNELEMCMCPTPRRNEQLLGQADVRALAPSLAHRPGSQPLFQGALYRRSKRRASSRLRKEERALESSRTPPNRLLREEGVGALCPPAAVCWA